MESSQSSAKLSSTPDRLLVFGQGVYTDEYFMAWNYAKYDNTLFIPEIQRFEGSAAQAFNVFGEHDAIGLSPFNLVACEGVSPKRNEENPEQGPEGRIHYPESLNRRRNRKILRAIQQEK